MGMFSKPTTPPPNNSAFSKFDPSQIGTGKNFREGSYGKARGGLKGQLSRMRRAGVHSSTSNISKRNMTQMHDIMAKRLGGKATGGKVTSKDIRAMRGEAYKLMKDPNADFTREDYKDFQKVLKRFNEPTVKRRAQPMEDLPTQEPSKQAGTTPAALESPQGLRRPIGTIQAPAMVKKTKFATSGSTGVKGLKGVEYDKVLPDKPEKVEPPTPTIPKAAEAIDIMID